VLDERVRAVLERLEREEPRPPGVPVAPATGRFLFSLVAPQTDCEVLEVGGGPGYSSIWLGAGVRHLAGRVLSIEGDSQIAAAWRQNVTAAGLEDSCELLQGDALDVLSEIDDVFDVVFLDGKNLEYNAYFELVRPKLEPGALVVADDVVLHEDTLAAYVEARQSDPTLVSTTVPLDRGLELSVVLSESL
jgi:predicted O-methyltransferase YrrM